LLHDTLNITRLFRSPDNGNPEAEATLQRQRGLALPNAAVATNGMASVGKPSPSLR
jgi:hypothetical protein